MTPFCFQKSYTYLGLYHLGFYQLFPQYCYSLKFFSSFSCVCVCSLHTVRKNSCITKLKSKCQTQSPARPFIVPQVWERVFTYLNLFTRPAHKQALTYMVLNTFSLKYVQKLLIQHQDIPLIIFCINRFTISQQCTDRSTAKDGFQQTFPTNYRFYQLCKSSD